LRAPGPADCAFVSGQPLLQAAATARMSRWRQFARLPRGMAAERGVQMVIGGPNHLTRRASGVGRAHLFHGLAGAAPQTRQSAPKLHLFTSWGISWGLSKPGRLLLGGFGPTGGGLLILGRLLDLLGDLVDDLFLRVVKARGLLELV